MIFPPTIPNFFQAETWNTYLSFYLALSTWNLRFEVDGIWATSWENLFMTYANNKGIDQPVHPRSLISAFVVRWLDKFSIKSILAKSKISRLIVSVVAQTSLSRTWSKIRKTGFLVTWLIFVWCCLYKNSIVRTTCISFCHGNNFLTYMSDNIVVFDETKCFIYFVENLILKKRNPFLNEQ